MKKYDILYQIGEHGSGIVFFHDHPHLCSEHQSLALFCLNIENICENAHMCLQCLDRIYFSIPKGIEAWHKYLKDHPDIALELAPDLL